MWCYFCIWKDYRVSVRTYHWIKHSLNCQHLRYICLCTYAYCLHIHYVLIADRFVVGVAFSLLLARRFLFRFLTPRYFYFQRSRQLHDRAKSNSKPSTSNMRGITTVRWLMLGLWWWWWWRRCCYWWQLLLAKFSLAQNNSYHCHIYEKAEKRERNKIKNKQIITEKCWIEK